MCHHRERAWTDAATDDEATADDAEEDLPSFLNEEATDTEVLTDGGDEA